MRTIHFTLDDTQAEDYNKIANLTQTLGMTPKNFFLRAMRMELKSADLYEATEIAARPKLKGRPPVIINGLERKEWVAARINAYHEAEKDALHFDPDHQCLDEDLVRSMAEGCWDLAEGGKSVPGYLKTIDGKLYSIEFPKFEDE